MQVAPGSAAIRSMIQRMIKYTDQVITETTKLFTTRSVEERKEVWVKVDNLTSALEELRKEVINSILLYIARTQPLGLELMSSYAELSVAYDIYRISRYCREIVLVDALLAPAYGVADIEGMLEVYNKAAEAVKLALRDLEEQRPINRHKVVAIDNEIDAYYSNLLKYVASSSSVPNLVAFKVLIMRHVERIVDHAHYIEGYLEEIS